MKIKEIAETYHDREVYSHTTLSPFGYDDKIQLLTCKCCEKEVRTIVSIEHDSRDYSKDMGVCFDCYTDISDYWNENSPGKICPF